ncbi:MAG: glycosyl transferase family 1 [Candidatus Moranbacteria bacterium CG23_combo_of_CG06-09_8_20_14_all_35_22]|nr:MAG: glycosyl transferase family 1 [Candidatus Moranbacteria bacterium CG23_combo_of_CG06-09_8_20_14_all_35_22]
MKICIDARCLMEGRMTGVEEYTRQLLSHIFLIDKKNEYVLFLNSWKEIKTDFRWLEKYPNVKIKKFNFPNKLLNLMFWYLGWPRIDRLVGESDAVFSPNIIFGNVSAKTKSVITIHDLSFFRHSEYFSPKRKWWHIFINSKKICRRADKIIAVSQSTKNDLIDLYKINPEKITVIPSAVPDNFCIISRNDKKLIEVKEKFNLPYKFILFFGTIEPRKNIAGLIKAFNLLQAQGAEYKLVIAGEKGWMNEEIYGEIEKSPFREKIQVINSVPDEDKVFLYNLASLFVYPSFFEGFGFPPLEAMRCGVPVIASNNSSLPEVSGGGAILIDPDKPDEIFLAMKEILENPELKENLIKKGLERSREFDWKKTAKETLEVLEA